MRVCFCFVACVVALAFSAAARERFAPSEALALDALRVQITGHIREERFRNAQWGVKVVSLDTGALIFEHAADKLLKPASNAKLYTGALALDALGSDFRIRTSLYSTKAPREGVLEGDLVVYGRGDPSFSTRFGEVDYTNLLSKVVRAIRDAGIRKIKGDLVGDSTFFSGPPYGNGWNWDDLQYYYGAEVSALSVQDNTIDLLMHAGRTAGAPCRIVARPATSFAQLINRLETGGRDAAIRIERPLGENRVFISGHLPRGETRTDAVTVSNPALWFVTILRESLEQNGIEVGGSVRVLTTVESEPINTSRFKEIGSIESPPLSEIIPKMMKPSQNLYSQLLLLQVGAQWGKKEAGRTTEELGLEAMGAFVRRAGIDPGEVLLDDGTGLSRNGLVTASATVRLLGFMARHKESAVFRTSLPEPGEGTLRNRLTEIKGKLRGKTGTLRYTDTLAGYMTTAAGEEVAFCVMLNAYNPPKGNTGREDVDTVARLIARLGKTERARTPRAN